MENGSLMEVESIAEFSPQTKALMENGSLMEFESIAKCNTFALH